MVGMCKEDVVSWYQGLSASRRLETVCALLDHSLPFELRFLGSVIEHLGRKDFHVLRDAECRTNALASAHPAPDHRAILQLLAEGPAPLTTSFHPLNESTSARPSPTSSNEQKTGESGGKRNPETPKSSENGLSSKSSTPRSSEVSGKGGEKCDIVSLANHVEVNSEESKDCRQDIWLHDGAKRRKLILYLSLLSSSNHDSANLYYILMSEVDEMMENLDWLEGADQVVQDEIQLLYTIGSHHPAFNFEQRTFLSNVLGRFQEYIDSCSKHVGQNFHDSPSPPNQILNHHYLPPQNFEGKFGGFYYYTAPPIQNIKCTQQSNPQSVTSGSMDGVRASNYPYVSYPTNFPVFMSPPHPHQPQLGHQFHAHPFAGAVMGSAMPVLQAHPFPQQVTMAPSSASLPISSPTSAVAPFTNNKVQLQSPNQPGGHKLPHGSTPPRAALKGHANSDGDSEESSENCAWDSPESSPFESPPQSITPSRSQSPRTQGSQTWNAVQVPATTQSSNVVPPVLGITHTSGSQNTSVKNPTSATTNCDRLSNSSTALPVEPTPVTTSSSSQSSTTLTKPRPKSNMSERRGRTPYIAGVSSLSTHRNFNKQVSSANSSASATATTSTSSVTSTVSMSNSPALSSSHSSSRPQRQGGRIQRATPPYSSQSPPCSNNNASNTNSTSNVSSSGDCAQLPKSVSCSNSATNLVTSSTSSPSSNTVITSAYSSKNFSTVASVASSANSYPTPLPQHHLVNQPMNTTTNNYSETFNSGNPLVNIVNTGYGTQQKNASSIHSPLSQDRMQPNLNSASNHNHSQQSSNQFSPQQAQQQHVMQQMMGPVVSQMQPSSASVNNLVGVVTPSMNTPLLSYGHPPGAINGHGHANYSAYPPTGVSYSSQGGHGSYRPNPQAAMLNQPTVFMPSHPGSLINNYTVNYSGPGVPFVRGGPPPTNTQGAGNLRGLGMTNPPSLPPPKPSHSSMPSQPGRSRGVILEIGGQVTSPEFTSPSSLENALMPPLEDPVEINCRPRKISCYNCGSNSHLGNECKEASMEEMTRKQYRLNYGGPSPADGKDGE